jgi:hypothetical protein
VRELARLGCSHLTVNALATRAPYEEGPPGEIYYRFYSASPDLDQFVATDLNAGIYPPEYLEANFNLLKRNAALAVKYGLTPGLTICSPRSVPEALLEKYPYLRGARVDHPYRSYRPRYTLTLSHPVVRWHYAEMLRKIVQAVPELGFLYLWTNDSGSGFEYVSTLYAGRNGGAYLIREWKTNEEILKSAAANVVRYLRLLRDAASVIHPGFRVVANAPSFGAEADSILDAIDSRIDMAVSPAEFTGSRRAEKYRQLSSKGSRLFGSTRISGNYIVGVPFPWLCFDRLRETALPGIGELSVVVDPPSLSPFDINREVVRMFQTETDGNTDSLVAGMAERWVGASRAPRLAGAWRDADSACRAFPDVPLYGNAWAFPWYRLWVRPFVPDIEKIPSNERAYYEEYMIATFNNPALVDFEIDALWDLIPPAQASEIVAQCDRNVWRTLDRAIATLHDGATAPGSEESAVRVFTDQYDRLVALRCYFRTLRNVAAWIADVHGYLGSARDAEKQVWLQRTRAMLRDETENTKALLELWKRSHTQFMPLSTVGETWSAYGDNFGKLLERKIALMEAHRNDLPFVDENFMWRLTPGSRVDLQTYIHY